MAPVKSQSRHEQTRAAVPVLRVPPLLGERCLGPRVGEGRIWMALHWAEARANLLTTAVGDAVTGTGEYKVCAARVQPL